MVFVYWSALAKDPSKRGFEIRASTDKAYLRITKLSQNMGAYKLLVKGAKQVVTVRNDENVRVLRGKEMQHVDIIKAKGKDGVSILVDR